MRLAVLVVLLTSCVPSQMAEVEPWPDMQDLLASRFPPGEVTYDLPWAVIDPPPERPPQQRRMETVHACLLLPLSGDRAVQGQAALKAAALAVEERSARAPAERRIAWHVVDTRGERQAAVEGADRCTRRGALVLAGPLIDRQVNEVIPAFSSRSPAVLLPEPGAADLTQWNDRFVAIGPAGGEMGAALGEDAAGWTGQHRGVVLAAPGSLGRDVAGRWKDVLEPAGWTIDEPIVVDGLGEADWRTAFEGAVSNGADAVLVAAPLDAAHALVQPLATHPTVRLWVIDAASQVPLLDAAEQAGVLDRIRCTLRRDPGRDFQKRYTARWGHRPSGSDASVYDAVERGTGGAETSTFLVHEDIAGAARSWMGPSAWGRPTRAGVRPLDYTADAGYQTVIGRRTEANAGALWEFVPPAASEEPTP